MLRFSSHFARLTFLRCEEFCTAVAGDDFPSGSRKTMANSLQPACQDCNVAFTRSSKFRLKIQVQNERELERDRTRENDVYMMYIDRF